MLCITTDGTHSHGLHYHQRHYHQRHYRQRHYHLRLEKNLIKEAATHNLSLSNDYGKSSINDLVIWYLKRATSQTYCIVHIPKECRGQRTSGYDDVTLRLLYRQKKENGGCK